MLTASERDPSLTYPPAADLDGDLLASTLLRMVMTSAALGHQWLSGTARDYCSHVDTPESRFVRDVLFKSTDEICDEWFGGRIQASIASSRVMELIIRPPNRDAEETT